MVRRPPPAPSTGRKPQTGLPPKKELRRGPRLGPHIEYLVRLSEGSLAELAAQESALRQKVLSSEPSRRDSLLAAAVPHPLTGPIRLLPAEDPQLLLDSEALTRLDPRARAKFNPKHPAVTVCVEFLGSISDLPALGMIPAVQSGDLFAGWVNLDQIKNLSEHKAVVRVEALRTFAPTGGGGENGSGSANGESSLSSGATGRGVRIAVIDLAFDFLHPALTRQGVGTDQVRALWLHDMAVKAPSVSPAGTMGRRFSADELQAALKWYTDEDPRTGLPLAISGHFGRLSEMQAAPDYRDLVARHGTAVSGIAAGNGRASDGGPTLVVPGVATEADLLFIAIGGHDETRFADSTEVLAGFQAAFEDPHVPCVALMANSDNLGPHDGSLEGERFIDDMLLLPGRAIVLTAGNFNRSITDPQAFHAVAQLDPESGPSLPLVLKFDVGAVSPDSAEIWFQPVAEGKATATVSIQLDGTSIGQPVEVREGEPVVLLKPNQNPDETAVTAQLHSDDQADACCLRLVFRPGPEKEIVASEWIINVAATGAVHGWLDRNNSGIGRWVGPTAQAGADLTTLGSPSSATRPLCVGSIKEREGPVSQSSGRGPLRTSARNSRKPDLVAVGENITAPRGVPHARLQHIPQHSMTYQTFCPGGTSYAAPQVAGACALLFELFGPAATWADIRQGILQATAPGAAMGLSDHNGWNSACGFGRFGLTAMLSPSIPSVPDVWLPKAPGDTGREPFVAWTFWDSPALTLQDSAGNQLDPAAVAAGQATPTKLRVRLANRGPSSSSDVIVTTWWAPLGAMHPLPQPGVQRGAWMATGFAVNGQTSNLQRVAEISPDTEFDLVFDWMPPQNNDASGVPHILLAAAHCESDPYDPNDTLCAQNNVCALCVAVADDQMSARFNILGSDDTDGLIIWQDHPDARLRIENLPITALPWRDAEMFQASGQRSRPLFGFSNAASDMAIELSATLEHPKAIEQITDVLGADRLVLEGGLATIEGGQRLTLPRLRIAEGAPLTIIVAAVTQARGAIHLLHLSGGRRVGGSTVRFRPGSN